jgi:hypothetical protein
MFELSLPRRICAVACAACIGVSTGPASFAAASPSPAMIGTVTAVGSADVRGVRTSEATLFSGDRVRCFDRSYAKIFLNSGHRLEMSSNAEITLKRASGLTEIAMLSGQLDFTSSSLEPLQLDVRSLSVRAEPGESGRIASLSQNVVSIGAIEGSISVKNRETGESFVLRPGTSTVFGLHGSEPVSTAAASGSLPARQDAQQQQAPGQPPPTITIPPPSTKSGMSTTTKVLIIAGIGGAGAAIAAVANKGSESTPR